MQECYRTYLSSDSPMSLEAEEELFELQLTTTPRALPRASFVQTSALAFQCAGRTSNERSRSGKGRRVRQDEGLQRS